MAVDRRDVIMSNVPPESSASVKFWVGGVRLFLDTGSLFDRDASRKHGTRSQFQLGSVVHIYVHLEWGVPATPCACDEPAGVRDRLNCAASLSKSLSMSSCKGAISSFFGMSSNSCTKYM